MPFHRERTPHQRIIHAAQNAKTQVSRWLLNFGPYFIPIYLIRTYTLVWFETVAIGGNILAF